MTDEQQKLLIEAINSMKKATQFLAQVVEQLSPVPEWIGLKEASSILGVGYQELMRKCRDREFKPGIEFIDVSSGLRPSYRVNFPAVKKFYATLPEHRKA